MVCSSLFCIAPSFDLSVDTCSIALLIESTLAEAVSLEDTSEPLIVNLAPSAKASSRIPSSSAVTVTPSMVSVFALISTWPIISLSLTRFVPLISYDPAAKSSALPLIGFLTSAVPSLTAIIAPSANLAFVNSVSFSLMVSLLPSSVPTTLPFASFKSVPSMT